MLSHQFIYIFFDKQLYNVFDALYHNIYAMKQQHHYCCFLKALLSPSVHFPLLKNKMFPTLCQIVAKRKQVETK